MTSDNPQERTGYQVIARKWRPQRFAEVVGQQHVTRTLQNAFAHDRVGHAYLFTGPRGIGKTTSARIFAKLLNCERPMDLEPCCECEVCRAISAGRCLDVIEIDAASNTGVDNIRELRETVRYTPGQGKVKVYIIDEVHMLSKAAWNALLKTLEEPPPHVKFVLATTEPHKVLPTIVSRCQRLDFRRIPVSLIVEQLEKIVQAEGIHVERGALAAIARVADGAMRDAQSLLDQMIAFRGGLSPEETIREQDVIDVFGLASSAELAGLVRGVLANDLPECLRVVAGLADRGRDLERVLADAIRFTRNALVTVMCGREAGSLLDVSEAEFEEIKAVCSGADADSLQRILDGLLSSEGSLRQALNKRVCLEAALARIIRDVHGLRIEDVIEKLAGVSTPDASSGSGRRQSPGDGGSGGRSGASAAKPAVSRPAPESGPEPRPAPPGGRSSTVRATSRREAPETAVSGQGGAAERTPEERKRPGDAAPPHAASSRPDATPGSAAEDDSAESARPGPQDVPAPESGQPGECSGDAGTASEDASLVSPDGIAEAAPEASGTKPAVAAEENDADNAGVRRDPGASRRAAETGAGEVRESPPGESPGERPSDGPAGIEPADLWHDLVAEVGRIPEQQALHRALQKLRPLDYRHGILEAAIDDQVPPEDRAVLGQSDVQRVLDESLRRIMPDVPDGRVLIKKWIPSMSNERRRLRPSPEVRKKVEANPFVRQVCDLFGGRIVDVRG